MAFNKHQSECSDCVASAKAQYCLHRGIDPSLHSCLEMAHAVSHPIESVHQRRNRVLDWNSAWNEYRIPIAYDGYKATRIRYCPWCGSELSTSKREAWYQRLYALGFEDPGEQHIPEDFETDKWWRSS